jgi:hypothetical protein
MTIEHTDSLREFNDLHNKNQKELGHNKGLNVNKEGPNIFNLTCSP